MIIDIAVFELRRLLSSPLAWIILAITQLLLALLFYNLLKVKTDRQFLQVLEDVSHIIF